MNRTISTLCICILSFTANAADRVKLPQTLKISLGGSIWGPTYSVELQNDTLKYTARDQGKETTEVVKPTATQWAAFRKALDACDVWSWRRTRTNELDQRSWSVNIAYKDAKVDRSGSGDSPGRTPIGLGRTKEFDEFQKAVQALLGGKDFK